MRIAVFLVALAACARTPPHEEAVVDAARGPAPTVSVSVSVATPPIVILIDASADGEAASPAAGCARCGVREYCLRSQSKIHGTNYGMRSIQTSCLPLPASCGAKPACACLADEIAGNCNVVDGQLRVWRPALNP